MVTKKVKEKTKSKESQEQTLKGLRFPEPIVDPRVLKDLRGASISLLSKDLRVLWANRYLEQIHGPLPKMVGKNCYLVYHKRNKVCEDCVPAVAFKKKSIQTGLLKRISRNGKTRYLQSVAIPFLDAEGEVQRVLEIAFDVTKEKLIEFDLAKSEEFYRTLFEHSGTAIAINNKDGLLTSVNRTFAELAGYSKDQIEGKKHYLEFVVDKDRVDRIHRNRWEGKGRSLTRYDFIFLTKDGKERFIDISINKIPGTDFSIASMIDVTEKRELEMEMRETEQFLANIIQESADAIIVTDKKGVIRTWNKGAEQIFGFQENEALGKNIHTLVPQDLYEAGELQEIEKKCIENGHVRNHVTERLRKDKRRIYIAQTLTLIKDAMGNPIGIARIARDITERKRLEQELIQTDKMKSIGTLSASLAHEIKNPLNSIVINMEILKNQLSKNYSEQERKPYDKYIDIIQTEVSRLDKVIKDFLDFAKPQTTQFKTVRINDIIKNVADFIEPETKKSQVTIYKKLFSKLYSIHGEENQLKQILLNLMLNSVQSMPSGGTITIRTQNLTDGKIQISIHDTGSGILPEHQSQIFDPFFTTRKKGSGLGLPMVQQLVKNHGGQISFKSTPNKGTTFLLTFPAI